MHLVYSLSTLREMHALFHGTRQQTAQMNDVPMTCELPVVVRRQ